jgi:uncharacterized protein (TIGR03663 family)
MSRGLFWLVFAAALALGGAFRLADPGVRPMHHDEANQAVRFGTLLESGEYRYDPHDHHGPTLYYLTLPFAWARGQWTLAALDERTLRMVPAVFGTGLILLFLLLPRGFEGPSHGRGLGHGAVAIAAALGAVSPVLTYYSRFYIQEALLVFFVLAFLIALGRYARRPSMTSAILAGAMAGLAYATKETSLIVLPVSGLACVIAAGAAREGRDPARPAPGAWAPHAFAAMGAALVPALLLYSAWLRHPAGFLDAFSAIPIYLSRGVEPGPHAQGFSYYLGMLSWSSSGGLVWSDALVLVLAAAGIAQAIGTRRRAFWPLYICLYTIGTLAIFSAIRYKTPWNVLPFYVGLILTAGIGGAALFERLRHRATRAVLVIALAAAGWQLAEQSARASFRYPADERNPYAYAHTSTDFVRLAVRVQDLAAQHPDGRNMLVKVVAGPYEQWPFPWYARNLRRVGYWSTAAAAGPFDGVPVIVASQENAAAVEAEVGDRYISEFYGLRPGVLLTLYVERGLWERLLKARTGTP